MINSYLIRSEHLKDKRINSYFQEKGWVKFDKKKYQDPTLIYLEGMSIYNKDIYNYNSFVKNQISNDKDQLTDKDNLPKILSNKYQLKTYIINLKNFVAKKYKNLFTADKIWILKPARGREGIGIKIVKKYEDFYNYLSRDIKKINFKIKRTDVWVLQEYISKPLLYMERKFHLRVYFMIFKKNIYLFPHYLIITAKDKYLKKDFNNKDIHDTHYANSIKNKIFPEDFELDDKKIKIIQEQIFYLFKELKKNIKSMDCYNEDKNCFELFAADMMLTEDFKLKILEINARIGAKGLKVMNNKFNMFEDQLNIVLGKLFNYDTGENLFFQI